MLGKSDTIAYGHQTRPASRLKLSGPSADCGIRQAANGGAKPVRSIAGQNTEFTRTIHDMAYDHGSEQILVPSVLSFAILTFRGDANGAFRGAQDFRTPHNS